MAEKKRTRRRKEKTFPFFVILRFLIIPSQAEERDGGGLNAGAISLVRNHPRCHVHPRSPPGGGARFPIIASSDRVLRYFAKGRTAGGCGCLLSEMTWQRQGCGLMGYMLVHPHLLRQLTKGPDPPKFGTKLDRPIFQPWPSIWYSSYILRAKI